MTVPDDHGPEAGDAQEPEAGDVLEPEAGEPQGSGAGDAQEPEAGDVQEPEVGEPSERRPRRHRRVVAPPTNPEADQSDDAAPDGPRRLVARDDDHPTGSPRDRWITEQRPPHWD